MNSTNVVAGFRASFPKIKHGIVVGVCRGVLDGTGCGTEVMIRDIIISTALMQYDFVRQYDNKVVKRDTLQDNLNRPNAKIRAFLAKHSGLRGRKQLRKIISCYWEDLCGREDVKHYLHPGAQNDKLYDPAYRRKHYNPDACRICASCQGPDDDVCDEALESSCADLGYQDDMTIPRARVEKAKGVTTNRRPPTDEELQETRGTLHPLQHDCIWRFSHEIKTPS